MQLKERIKANEIFSGIPNLPKSGYRKKRRFSFCVTHNSARSQMAEGLLRAIYGDRSIRGLQRRR